MEFKSKLSKSVQFEEHQLAWLISKAAEKAIKEQRKVSVAEINRDILQKEIDLEKSQT